MDSGAIRRRLGTGLALLTASGLLALAAPALAMRTWPQDASSQPADLTTRQAHDLVADELGPGANGPITFVAPADRVVLAGYQNPDLLFCLDRKGWILPDAAASPARVRELRDAGAAAVLVMNRGSDQLTDWLEHNGRRVVENRRFRLYKLTPGPQVGTR